MSNIYRNEDSLIFQNAFYDFSTGKLISPVKTQNYTVVQVTESFYRNKFIIERHKQYCDIEITFPLTNGLVCATNGKEQKVNKNEAYISFKGDYHKLSSRQGCRFQTLAINFQNGSENQIFNKIKDKFKVAPKAYIADISVHFTEIIAEFLSEDTPFLKSSLDSHITLILIKLVRGGECKTKSDALSADKKVSSIMNYIDAHYLDICSLDELSAQFGYTYTHICKLFKKTYGITPKEHLNLKKMEYAKGLLKEGKGVGYISEQLGYSTPYNFSRAFKNTYGVSPANLKI